MASRPAPRKSTRDERAFLADVRRAARNKNISMTDVYNYERTKNEQFNQGLSSARAVEGLTTPTPQRVEFDISKARSLEGLTNKSSEGTGIANIVGRPGYVGSMYKMGDAYYPAGEGSLTDSLNSIASFVKDNPRLSAETTALSLAGTFGRLSGQGGSFADFLAENANAGGLGIRRGTVESMRGELSRPASAMDVVDATTYATPGAALKGLGLIAKGTASAAKAGRAIGGLAVGSKPARVATGLAAGAGGYAGYTEAKPEEAEAVSFGANIKRIIKAGGVKDVDKLQDLKPSRIIDLLNDPKYSKWVISRSQTSTRRAAPSYDDNAAMRHWIDNDPAANGLSYNIARKRWRSSAFKEQRKAYTKNLIDTGVMTPHTDQDLIDKTKDLLSTYTDADGNWVSENARRTFFEGASGSVEGRNAFHLAHGTSIKKGGPLSPDNTYWKRGKANLKEGIG
jgi:hypothetical protein